MSLADPGRESAATSPRSSSAAGLFWFLVFAAVGAAAVAAAVLLPEYVTLAKLQAKRDALGHQVECEGRLAAYNDRLIGAMETDPVVTARLLIRYANYSPSGFREVPIDPACLDDPTPVKILADAANPPKRPQGLLAVVGKRLFDPSMRMGLIALGLGTIAIGWLLFGVRVREPGRSVSASGEA